MWHKTLLLTLLLLVFALACTSQESGKDLDITTTCGLGSDITSCDAADPQTPDGSDVAADVSCRLKKTWTEAPIGAMNCSEYEQDENGHETKQSYDEECDGVPERCLRTEWDQSGRMTGTYEDKDCDNTVDYLCLWSDYDDDASSVMDTEDNDCDGSPDFVRVFVFDDGGNVLSESVTEGALSGGQKYCYYYRYDEFGNQEEAATDLDCDGSREYCSASVSDADGNPTTSHEDDGCDGIPDRNCREYEATWDPDGTVHRVQRLDSKCDGTETHCWTSVESPEGLLLSSSSDQGCDSEAESCWALVFDDNGNLLHKTVEEPCGSTPKICAYAFTVNEEGLQTSSQTDDDCNGSPMDCITLTYDNTGKVIASTTDEFCSDGSYVQCETYEYDAYGNQIRHHTEPQCGQDYFLTYLTTYDCH